MASLLNSRSRQWFAVLFVAKLLWLCVLILHPEAFANVQQNNDAYPASNKNLQQTLEPRLLVNGRANGQAHFGMSKSAKPSTIKPRLKMDKQLGPSNGALTGDFLTGDKEDEDLKIATGVQSTTKIENYLISDQQSADQLTQDEDYLEPYAGEFTPNTEEEDNIILASILIIFTGAVIIALISYL